MSKTTTYMNPFRIVLGAAALAGVFALVGCFPTDDEGTPPATVDPRVVLRDTGKVVFEANCSGCHGMDGEGGRGPQVANSDFLMNNRQRVIHILLEGNTDSLRVNGVKYEGGGMPGWADMLTDFEIAGTLTYLRSVLNDSLVTNCTTGDDPVCTKTARDPAVMDLDSVAVWEVAAVRDSLIPR